MSETERANSILVPRQAMIDLAVEAWRLSQWVLANPIHAKAPARRADQRLQVFLNGLKLEVLDLTGKPYDLGLAVEVLGYTDESGVETTISVVDEMVSPIVVCDGRVAKHGQVILRRQQLPNCGEEAKL